MTTVAGTEQPMWNHSQEVAMSWLEQLAVILTALTALAVAAILTAASAVPEILTALLASLHRFSPSPQLSPAEC